MNCAGCKEKACYKGKDCTEIAEEVSEEYKDGFKAFTSINDNIASINIATG